MRNREEVVKTALTYMNVKQGSVIHKHIIDRYNSIRPRHGCTMGYNSPWCACFVSFISHLTNNIDIMPEHTSCGEMIKLYQRIGSWEEKDDFIPMPGDIIFYDWDDDGVGDDTTGHDHVGIIESCDGKTITVIEGNSGNEHKVARRIIKVNSRYIRGFGLPKYTDDILIPSYKYIVQKGDTIAKISKKLEKEGIYIHWRRLAEINNIKNPNLIYPGQELEVKE